MKRTGKTKELMDSFPLDVQMFLKSFTMQCYFHHDDMPFRLALTFDTHYDFYYYCPDEDCETRVVIQRKKN